ncbi:acyltransferase [Derxia gummosa]|uniref:Acyltransferase n=1 Tax=Derxia gummosa DSM 723 TaxID=1121388 RepID=A0A8B6XBZ2_9BURK|nr:hypothetical protein [Derxia gummosa]
MASNKVRLLLALAVSAIPVGKLRAFAYRSFFGYRIGAGTRFGLGAVVAVDDFECGEKVVIGRSTRLLGPMKVSLGARTFIGRWNRFECTAVAASDGKAHMGYARRLVFGSDCLVHENHFFDVYGEISVGDGSWIAGRDSQFWTHGASVVDRDIRIGRNCYVGSAARFAPGSGIGDRVVVGLGAVVTRRIADSDVVVGGLPAKVLRTREAGGDGLVFKTWE